MHKKMKECNLIKENNLTKSLKLQQIPPFQTP